MKPLDRNLFGPDQQCFGCGPTNTTGMQLVFHEDGEDVVTRFTAKPGWEGPPGIMHGGLQATLADEIGAWTVVVKTGNFGFTASMQLRYLRPAKITAPIEARGTLVETTERGLAKVRVKLTQDGKTLLSGTIRYAMPTAEQAEKVLGQPVPEDWQHLTRG